MPPSDINFEQLKDRMRQTWMDGDFGQIARHATKAAEEFVERLTLSPGMRVLDVACGTGNLTIPAARKGAQMVGVDIAPNLVEQARQRAEAEGLEVSFEEGDAEQLNYPDASFDLVMSMFGAMFAPRPEKVSEELMRVCRRGGIVAMANWTPTGFSGKMFALSARYVSPPAEVPPPVLWGEESVVRERLNSYAAKIEMAQRRILFEFPFPPKEVVQLFRTYFGPTKTAFSKLDEAGKTSYATDLEDLWSEHNESSDGRTVVQSEYLEVIATKA